MSLAGHRKSYLICAEFLKFKILRNIYFDFFQCTKLRQPTGQRQLLENKQILRNISRFLTSRFRQIAFLMTLCHNT